MSWSSSPLVSRIRSNLRAMFTIDLRSLGVFRIALGGILLLDLALRARWFSDVYTREGALLLERIPPRSPLLSLHDLSGAPALQAALFAIAAVFAVMLLVGYRTRIATIVSWVFAMSLQHAWLDLGDGGDAILRALLFWSIFLPLGARFSVDARRSGEPTPTAPAFSAATIAILLQFVFIYFFTGLAKTGPEWKNGLAIELALAETYWTQPLGNVLHEYPRLLRLLTPTVLYFEIFGPLVMLMSFSQGIVRLLTIAAFWSFQLGLTLCIQLNIFQLVCAAATLPFLPLWLWDRIDARRGRAAAGAPRPDPRPWLPRTVQVAVSVALLGVFASNLESVKVISWPGTLTRLGQFAGMDQDWNMYAPRPPLEDFWFEFEFEPAAIADSEKGRLRQLAVTRLQRDYRFKYYLQRTMNRKRRAERIEHYLDWMCREWNTGLPADEQIESIGMAIGVETTLRGGRPPQRIPLATRPCT